MSEPKLQLTQFINNAGDSLALLNTAWSGLSQFLLEPANGGPNGDGQITVSNGPPAAPSLPWPISLRS